jgi:hypothetical protein
MKTVLSRTTDGELQCALRILIRKTRCYDTTYTERSKNFAAEHAKHLKLVAANQFRNTVLDRTWENTTQ